MTEPVDPTYGTSALTTYGGGPGATYGLVEAGAPEGSRRPCQVCRVYYDRCKNTYGVAPCTAALGVTGDAPCFNGPATCQDLANLDTEDAFVTVSTDAAPGVQEAGQPAAFPTLTALDIAATRLRPGQNLGDRGVAQVTIQDHPFNDEGFDPYKSTRGVDYDDGDHGTFWQRFLARFPYFEKRKLEIWTGYLDESTGAWDYDSAEPLTYLIESIAGPDAASGAITIVAKDPLKLADEKQAMTPTPSTGILAADMDTVTGVATLSAAAQVAQYQAAWDAGQKWLRIGKEVIELLGRPTTVDLSVARSQGPSIYDQNDIILEEHAAGDTVQVCTWISGRLDAVCQYLLETVSQVDTAFLDLVGWAALCDVWASDWNFQALITEPTSAKQLLNEICAHSVMLWWDDSAALVKLDILKPQPNADVSTLTDDQHIVAGSVSVGRDSSQRVSQVWLYYGQRNPVEKLDAAGNFAVTDIDVAGDEETNYQAKAVRFIRSRWLHQADRAIAATIGARILNYYKDTKTVVSLTIDAKDTAAAVTGNDVDLLTRYVRDATGNKLLYRFLVTEAKRIFPPSGGASSQVVIRCDGKVDPTANRAFLWAPDTDPSTGLPMPEYAAAGSAIQWTYGWWSPASPLLPYAWS